MPRTRSSYLRPLTIRGTPTQPHGHYQELLCLETPLRFGGEALQAGAAGVGAGIIVNFGWKRIRMRFFRYHLMALVRATPSLRPTLSRPFKGRSLLWRQVERSLRCFQKRHSLCRPPRTTTKTTKTRTHPRLAPSEGNSKALKPAHLSRTFSRDWCKSAQSVWRTRF